MFTNAVSAQSPFEDLLLRIFTDPALFLFCVAVLAAIVIGGYGAYSLLLKSSSKRLAMNDTDKFLAILREEAAREGDAHGQESAQKLLNEWEEKLEGKIKGEEGIIRLKKFNLKAETFLKKRGLL